MSFDNFVIELLPLSTSLVIIWLLDCRATTYFKSYKNTNLIRLSFTSSYKEIDKLVYKFSIDYFWLFRSNQSQKERNVTAPHSILGEYTVWPDYLSRFLLCSLATLVGKDESHALRNQLKAFQFWSCFYWIFSVVILENAVRSRVSRWICHTGTISQ